MDVIECRRRLLMQSTVQPPPGYQFIAYAMSDTGISNGARVDLPFGFDRADSLATMASCGILNDDKYMVAPSQWNDDGNRFALVGGPFSDRFGVGYGSYPTTSERCIWSSNVIQRDVDFHNWSYKDQRFKSYCDKCIVRWRNKKSTALLWL